MYNQLMFLVRQAFPKLPHQIEKGQGLVEYGLILLLIAIVVIASVRLFGVQVTDLYTEIVERFNEISNGG